MDMTPLKLDALPTEILRQIVSLIQYEDVLTLLTVNRTFHSICNDWMIYDAIIKNGNSRRGCEWQGPPLTGADSISAWARYALADSKAANTSQWSEMDWIQCGPQLMTLSHPMLYDSAYGPLWSYYTRSHGDQKTLLVFCLALKLMSQRSPDDFTQSYLGSTETYRSVLEIRHSLLDVLRTKLLSAARPSWGNHSAISNVYCKALKAQGIMSLVFRETLIKGSIWYQPRTIHHYASSTADIAVPATETIDFHHLMDMPLPFTTDATAQFQYCHLPKMTSKHFLEDGEWAGVYYARTRGGSNFPRFAPPMHNVRFRVNLDPAQPFFVSLEASGRNGLGEFSLRGRMEKESGQMTLEQVYTGGTQKWDWTCMMTPFGIVGSWGDRRQFRGWTWLWKVQ